MQSLVFLDLALGFLHCQVNGRVHVPARLRGLDHFQPRHPGPDLSHLPPLHIINGPGIEDNLYFLNIVEEFLKLAHFFMNVVAQRSGNLYPSARDFNLHGEPPNYLIKLLYQKQI
jgi:hypothetical protein